MTPFPTSLNGWGNASLQKMPEYQLGLFEERIYDWLYLSTSDWICEAES